MTMFPKVANVNPTKAVAYLHASFHAKRQNVQYGVQSTSCMDFDTDPKLLLESKTAATIAGCRFTDSFITPVRVECAGEIIGSRLCSELHLSYSVD